MNGVVGVLQTSLWRELNVQVRSDCAKKKSHFGCWIRLKILIEFHIFLLSPYLDKVEKMHELFHPPKYH